MLVLTRKLNEEIVIGDDIKITLVKVKGGSVRLGIDAPRGVKVLRGEISEREFAAETEDDEIDPMAEVFAQGESRKPKATAASLPSVINRVMEAESSDKESKILFGKAKLNDASRPLARFVSAG
ncbi:MAG: carbon storage regulator CsrA [Planctomycetota bacterium]